MLRLLNTASFRLSILYGAVFALCFATLLAVTYFTATAALREQISARVTEETQALLVEYNNDGRGSVVQDIEERLKLSGNAGSYYVVYDENGNKLAGNLQQLPRLASWVERDFQQVLPPQATATIDQDHQLWGQGTALVDGGFLFVGQDAFRVLAAQEAVIDAFAWAAAIAFLLAAAGGIFLSGRFLRRIDAINRTSQAIMEGNLKERIPVRGTSDEIDKLSLNLNQLFDGNQLLLESLRQVTTDIAHDLRSPLSRLRQGLEEARMWEGDAQSYVKAIDGAIVESDQLLSTFSALLRIAQIESGTRKLGFKDIDLSALLQRAFNAYSAVAEDSGKDLVANITPAISYHGDADLLLQMFVNMLENAIRHTPAGTRINLTLELRHGAPFAVVSDSGPGIPVVLRDKVFQRFFRLETSRTTHGNGLGLAMVAAVSGLHGIAVALKDNHPGLRVELNFPPI